MVNCCANPACRAEFKLLSSGDLYAHERRYANTEFFWLCSACSPILYLYLRSDLAGCVSLKARTDTVCGGPPQRDGNLRLVVREGRTLPFRQTVFADLPDRRSGFGVGSITPSLEAA